MPDVYSGKREWVERSIQGHEIWRQWSTEGLYVGRGTDEAYEVTFGKRWVPVERCKKLPLEKGGSMLRGEVVWIRARLSGVRRLEVLRQFRPQASNSVGMGDSWWEEWCLWFWSSSVVLGGSSAWDFWRFFWDFKSIFTYFFMRFMFVFCSDRMKATQTIKNIVVFRLHSS